MDIKSQILDCRQKILLLRKADRVPLRIAKFLIENSAYWDHPSGGMVKAPKHAENITSGYHGLELTFGANSFLIEYAVTQCVVLLSQLLDSVAKGNRVCTCQELRSNFAFIISGAVANRNGDKYNGQYPCYGNKMYFGTQVINVQEFANVIISTSNIEGVYRCLSTTTSSSKIKLPTFNISPKPMSPCESDLLSYWEVVSQFRTRYRDWPPSVFWHFVTPYCAKLPEHVQEKIKRNFFAIKDN